MKKMLFGILLVAFVATVCMFHYYMKDEAVIEPEYVLTYAENQSEDHPTTQAAYKFAKLVEEKTDGKVLIEVVHSGELGMQSDIVDQLQFGGIDLARISLSAISDELPRMNVLQLPFLYQDEEQMWDILRSEIGTAALGSLERIQLVGLSWYEAGTRSFYSAQGPIRSLEDFKGKIVRVQESEAMKDWIVALGGTPVEVPYSDIYSAFEKGTIDIAENNWTSYVAEKHYEVAKYFTITDHARVPEIQIMSQHTWNQLPVNYRYMISQCAKESAEYEKDLWTAYTKNAIETARKEGCVISYLSQEEIAKCEEMVLPIYEKHCYDFLYLIEKIKAQE